VHLNKSFIILHTVLLYVNIPALALMREADLLQLNLYGLFVQRVGRGEYPTPTSTDWESLSSLFLAELPM
jgi:hypothetical protein